MWFLDVNVLLYAHKEELPRHPAYAGWLETTVADRQPFALSSGVLSGFVRIATDPKLFSPPSTLEEALAFAVALREQPGCRMLEPGAAHWSIFTGLCRAVSATGNLVPDAYLAAVAVEHGCELVTADRNFARFPGLRWRHLLDG